jgi:cell division protein FtsB
MKRDFQNKKTQKNVLYSWPVLVFLFIVLLFSMWGVFSFLLKMGDTSKNRNIAEMRVLELQKSKDKLSNDIESLKTDKGLEENIRDKFGLAKEGEGLIVVVDEKNAEAAPEEPGKSWFSGFWDNWMK